MNRVERIEAVIAGKPADRIPASVWMHFSDVDQDPRMLAEAQAAFNEKYDFDFIKLMPFGLYSVQDWGTQVRFFCRKGEEPIVYKDAIGCVPDYRNLKTLDPRHGTYGKQLELVEHMSRVVPPKTPYIMTIFSPLTTLSKLAGRRMADDLKNEPDAVKAALGVITETTISFVNECIKAGAYGFFFATQTATRNLISDKEFREFCEPYDLAVINAFSKKTMFNIVHIHGDNIMFEEVMRYPIDCINWHDRNTEPSLGEARQMTDKCFVGGIKEAPYFEGRVLKYSSVLAEHTPDEIKAHVREAIASVNGKGIIIAPGCVADPKTPKENLFAVREAVEIQANAD